MYSLHELELAAVQLICGIHSRSFLPQSTQLASAIVLSDQRTHAHTHVCTNSYFPAFHFFLNYVLSCLCGIKGTQILIYDFCLKNPQGWGCEKRVF